MPSPGLGGRTLVPENRGFAAKEVEVMGTTRVPFEGAQNNPLLENKKSIQISHTNMQFLEMERCWWGSGQGHS
jgi:hypothetical protein